MIVEYLTLRGSWSCVHELEPFDDSATFCRLCGAVFPAPAPDVDELDEVRVSVLERGWGGYDDELVCVACEKSPGWCLEHDETGGL